MLSAGEIPLEEEIEDAVRHECFSVSSVPENENEIDEESKEEISLKIVKKDLSRVKKWRNPYVKGYINRRIQEASR